MKIKTRFISENIRKFRVEQNLTREQLSQKFKEYKINVTDRTIQNWENGDTSPDADMIAIMAQIFDKPVTYFFNIVSYQTS